MKHLIVVHGRDIKPAGSELASLSKRAIVRGLQRAGRADIAQGVASGAVRFSSAYYGDINNRIEASYSAKTAALLTAQNDAGYAFRPCFPAAELEAAYAMTDALRSFNLAAYRHVLDIADDWRLLDEAADAASLFGSLLTFGLLNIAGYYDKLVEFWEHMGNVGFVRPQHQGLLLVDNTIDGLLTKMAEAQPVVPIAQLRREQL